ncbi:MAG: Trp family transcriptional regulator [bacterium]|nr:Trp family transcriptional regulator [bacterium]
MPHISKRKLDQKIFDKIFKELIIVLEQAQSKKKFTPVLNELLTKTEKIMLAKRLAIVLLLFGDIPQHRIAEVLLVSPTTVSKISFQVEMGKYDSIKNISIKEKIDLEKVIWLLLTAGGILPPRAGGRYWRGKGFKALLER